MIQIADPFGTPFNKNLVELFPNKDFIETNLDNYRTSDYELIMRES
jgi:hypothetical protein